MVKKSAQKWLSDIETGGIGTTAINKVNLKKIVANGDVNSATSEVENPAAGSELTGELTFEGFPNLEEIFLIENEITKLTIKNCPKLTKINISDNNTLAELNIDEIDPNGDNKLEELSCGGSKLKKISFRSCKNLKTFDCPNTPTLDRIEKIDSLENIESLNMANSGKVRIMHEVKYEYVTAVVNEVKDVLGIPHTDNLPMTAGKVDTSKIKDQIKAAANSQATADKNQAQKEAKEAKDSLSDTGKELGLTGNDAADKSKIVDEVKKLKNQATQAVNDLLNEINNLGLELTGNDITKEKVLQKINELIRKPTCTHTDYDTIKAERDSLKNKNVTREVLVEKDKENFSKWNINVPTDYQQQLISASATEVEEIRGKLIGDKINELEQSKKNATYLNIGLGVLTVGSLLVIIYLITRDKSSPVEEETDQAKK